MVQQTFKDKPDGKIGNVSAMLRLMGPLHGSVPDPVESRRRLVADLCRFIGTKIGMLAPGAPHDATILPATASPTTRPTESSPPVVDLSPRLSQTLQLLLQGDSEKQVALKLRLSHHTVHVYVKALYRRFDVGTRAELLARHLKR